MILYAPNVNAGGGYVLLLELLKTLPIGQACTLFLDARIKEKVSKIVDYHHVTWVGPKVFQRLRAEILLASVSSTDDLVLCFHGLPPIFSCRGRVSVYVQNRLLLSNLSNYRFQLRTRLRLGYEKMIFSIKCKHVESYCAQTASMKNCLEDWLIKKGVTDAATRVYVAPFADISSKKYKEILAVKNDKYYKFCYVADGQPHKNHMRLFQAMKILAEKGLTPRLAITLGEYETELLDQCRILNETFGTRIENLGSLNHHAVHKLYSKSEALVFPSLIESFGLPLIEAKNHQLPILASELDYVRDVCEPQETFNPMEPISISRALQRFMGQPEPLLPVLSATQFIEGLTKQLKVYL
jgi:glycosyltransferase involved in cell wall biosynthesis